MNDLLEQLRIKNHERVESFGHTLHEWSPSDWACATAGEVGEMCNLIKKMRRGEDIPIADVGREMADVVIYLDLLANHLGIDLKQAIVQKFNEVSERVKSDVRLKL